MCRRRKRVFTSKRFVPPGSATALLVPLLLAYFVLLSHIHESPWQAVNPRKASTLYVQNTPYLLLGSTSAFLQIRLEKRRPTPLMEVREY